MKRRFWAVVICAGLAAVATALRSSRAVMTPSASASIALNIALD